MVHNWPRKPVRLMILGDGSIPLSSSNFHLYIFQMQIKVNVEDIFGEHDDALKSDVLSAFKMEIPHHVVLHFPTRLVEKMRKVKEVADSMRLSSVKFALTSTDRGDSESERIEVFTKDGALIPITEYEEFGMHDTIRGFTLEYKWLSNAFQAHFHYNCSWWEVCFKTDQFKLREPST